MPAQVALAWLRYRAGALAVASEPIPGTRRASRVEDNLGSLSVTLPPAQLTALDAAGAALAGNRALTMVSAGREWQAAQLHQGEDAARERKLPTR
jgi:diketogulonate reductase-like aldo/keto reductase